MAEATPKIWRHIMMEDFIDVVEFANRHNLNPQELIVCNNVDFKSLDIAYYHHKELK